jgi:DNA-directed RNA polymerase sigma subunit (sigma70/sigma32)
METPIGDDEDSRLGDFIEDTAAESRSTPRRSSRCARRRLLRKLRHPSRSEQLRSFLIED